MTSKNKSADTQLENTISGVQVGYSFAEYSMVGFSWFLKFLSYVFGGLVLVFVVSLLIPYLEGAARSPVLNFIYDVVARCKEYLREQIPTKVGKQDLSIWILIVGTFFIKGTLSQSSDKLKDKVYFVHFKRKYELWKSQQHIKKGATITSKLDETLLDLRNAKPRDRDQILKQFIETKQKLDAMGRDLAFLSIDVVDSTKMKDGEEKAFIEHDFKEFKRFVEGVLVSNGALKQTWTPDGVMSCFLRVDHAVTAGRQVIIGLEAFNRNVKAMRQDFAVRCGVNAGFVYYDDNLPLEEIADRVIDIAGHFQKHAKPNTIWIAKPSIEPLGTRDGFSPTLEVVDGYEVYEWRKD
jgi:class 3 adenylate cyclase